MSLSLSICQDPWKSIGVRDFKNILDYCYIKARKLSNIILYNLLEIYKFLHRHIKVLIPRNLYKFFK